MNGLGRGYAPKIYTAPGVVMSLEGMSERSSKQNRVRKTIVAFSPPSYERQKKQCRVIRSELCGQKGALVRWRRRCYVQKVSRIPVCMTQIHRPINFRSRMQTEWSSVVHVVPLGKLNARLTYQISALANRCDSTPPPSGTRDVSCFCAAYKKEMRARCGYTKCGPFRR